MLCTSSACDSKSAERSEARSLLNALEQLREDHGLSSRQHAIDALGKLQLQSETHRQARDVCRSAHAGLLRAETQQAMARQALDAAAQPRAPGQEPPPKLSPERSREIAGWIADSNQALAAAKDSYPKCEQAMLALVAEAH